MYGNRVVLVACALLLTALFGASVARAEDKTVTGAVTAVMDDDGTVLMVTLTGDDGKEYNVDLDDNGKKLAKDLNGKRAAVTGAVEDKDGVLTITVKSFKAAAAKEK